LVAPMYHSAPNSYALRAVRQGELVVLLPRFDAEQLLRIIAEERITHLFMVPTMFVRLLNLPDAVRAQYDVSSLEWIIHAGSPCPPAVKQAMIAWLGPIIHEFYGGTESGCVTFADSADSLRHPGTVGRAIDGARIEIRRDDGSLAPAGEPGEIFMRILYLPDFTYIGRPDLRQEIEANGLITCGDVGYLDADGYLFICDRKRDMVIVGGVNVYPAEIEGVLIGMPGVHDCAVFGIPHPDYGEALMAVVQPEPGASLDPTDIRAYLTAHLAGYKVPRTIELRDDLPREESGKIFKRRLRDPYWQGLDRTI
jgi:long-chain acyl-CoA synthetase